jgi:hypothetical protein
MANDSYTQTALGDDFNFQRRMRANLMSVSWEVLNEADTVEFHDQRASFARQVIGNPDAYVKNISSWIVMRPNVMNFETTYSFPAMAVISAAGDPDIQSQLMTDWNDLAGVVPPPPVTT